MSSNFPVTKLVEQSVHTAYPMCNFMSIMQHKNSIIYVVEII